MCISCKWGLYTHPLENLRASLTLKSPVEKVTGWFLPIVGLGDNEYNKERI